ncbi:HEPN domain-containing protein [Bradyrhizobium sp. Leo121]|uniref:HEPN domain-containing protein n=1 Tax=Bradyrhizobium sp. Leo121 TaxID=1571195 RepID=UPI0010D67F56|nr:HEPN domain-containing protein [Bradyrhizobium sp. Leo121]RZN27663.1 hypothetical protein CWO90_24505 [Bradyrhizobium sp. Leo121]
MAALPRGTLQRLALAKIEDARLLYENSRFSNSYYLYGYGIELGLKACIARQMVAETVPDKAVLRGFLDHEITKLVGLAGLAEFLKTERENREFDVRWAIATEWSVESRYDMIDAVTAAAMRDAVENPEFGVMKWLQQFW